MTITDLMSAMNGIGSIVVGLYAIHVTVSVGVLGLFGTLRVRGTRMPVSVLILGSLIYAGFVYAQYYSFWFLNRKADSLLSLYRDTANFAEMIALNEEAAVFVASGYNTPFFNLVLVSGSGAVVLAIWILNILTFSADRQPALHADD